MLCPHDVWVNELAKLKSIHGIECHLHLLEHSKLSPGPGKYTNLSFVTSSYYTFIHCKVNWESNMNTNQKLGKIVSPFVLLNIWFPKSPSCIYMCVLICVHIWCTCNLFHLIQVVLYQTVLTTKSGLTIFISWPNINTNMKPYLQIKVHICSVWSKTHSRVNAKQLHVPIVFFIYFC